MSVKNNPWLVNYTNRPTAEVRLICFHYAGGSASAYRNWPKFLSANVDLLGVQLPGREGRYQEDFITNFDELIGKVVVALEPVIDKPYVVFGHSMGSLMSFECLRQIGSKGLPLPLFYIPAGRRSPQFPEDEPPIAHLPEGDFLTALLKEYEDNLGDVLRNKDLREVFIPQLRADFKLCENYCYREKEKLNCPIYAFGGEQEQKLGEKEIQGWAAHTNCEFFAKRFPGDHFFIHKSESMVVREINRYLAMYSFDQVAS
ncbi:thioesterase II family protein [Microbulbifer sp. TYP-18]|uniref:thioesterase II family protein n=1 Tax=Microbulbifer sp. TYP-18 TaxID=3230024 RepID=UPI0034C647BF